MKVRRIVVSDFRTNCYIYYDETKAFIIDPGADVKKIRVFLNENSITPSCILLTHGHIDHIGAAEVLANQYDIDIYIHPSDEPILRKANENLSGMFGSSYQLTKEVKYLKEEMELFDCKIKVHHTPGHTPGSCMIEFVDDHVIFSGDMLFKGSIGRYDFPTSSYQDIMQSVAYIKTIRYEAHVLPGHGEPTTLQREILYNPFFQG